LGNGTITYTSSEQTLVKGDKAAYTCNRGFDLEGAFIRECLGNRTWSAMTPQCIGM